MGKQFLTFEAIVGVKESKKSVCFFIAGHYSFF